MTRDTWLLDQLPVGMVSDDFFARFVQIFQEEAGTLVAHGENLPHLADPTVAPPAMVRWLASWIGLDGIDPGLPEATQRRMVTTAARTMYAGVSSCPPEPVPQVESRVGPPLAELFQIS